MNKRTKIAIGAFLSVFVILVSREIFSIANTSYRIVINDFQEYKWLFSDSVKNHLGPICSGKERESDNIYFYNYKRTYSILVWEFKDLRFLSPESVKINKNIDLDEVDFKSKIILDSKGESPISIRTGNFIENSFVVNLDEYSTIDSTIAAENYKGFYGSIHRMTFSDKQGKTYVIMDNFVKKQKCLFLVYKKKSRFVVIIISPFDFRKKFDTCAIRLFKLD